MTSADTIRGGSDSLLTLQPSDQARTYCTVLETASAVQPGIRSKTHNLHPEGKEQWKVAGSEGIEPSTSGSDLHPALCQLS